MTEFRILLRRALLVVLALSLPITVSAARKDRPERERPAQEAVDPAFVAMLGSAVPSSRVESLSTMLRAASLPADAAQAAANLPVFAALKQSGEPGSLKFEATDITLELVTMEYAPVRFEHARVALFPSADGRSCRFEVSGSPFGETTTFEASGTVEWAVGPAGGDKLDVVYRLGQAPVEALRALLPNRIDPSFRGFLDLRGKASGFVGETTTEELPATPLRGDFDATLDWQVLGRTAPVAILGQFALDDRLLRFRDSSMKWQGLELAVKGWLEPSPQGKFELSGSFVDVDTQKVSSDWNVPERWRPQAMVSGTIMLKGKKAGEGMLSYEARAPGVVLPAFDGYAIRVDAPKFKGSLLAINAEVSCSVSGENIRVGDLELGSMPVGVRWWRNEVTVSNSNVKLWGGENDGGASYEVAKHPEFSISGRVKNAVAKEMAAGIVPQLGLDVEGASSISYTLGQDAARKPYLSARASLLSGRFGGADLFARLFEALAAADPALALADAATLVPRPRTGTGTRVDRFFFELDRQGDVFELGGLFLRAGDFQIDADGRYAGKDGLHLDATVAIPTAIASQMVASAPWLAALRKGDAALFVPVVIGGTPAAPTLALAADYAGLLARAKRGEAVTAPGVRNVRHVGPDNLAVIPADPNTPLD